MRNLKPWLSVALLAGLAGCNPDGGGRINLIRPGGGGNPPPTETPSAADLVAYLNANSQGIPGIQSDDVSLTVHPSGGLPVTLTGRLRCQGPRNFRMTGNFLGSQEVDLGSNDQEFWYWIKRGDNYQVFCSYQALQDGKVKQMPFPFQPDWVLEAMGMGRYGPAEKYELAVEKDRLKLIEKTRSPQGQPIRKVIVFRRSKAVGNESQVTDYLLLDDTTGKEICAAHIGQRLILPKHGEIPRKLELRWPEQKIKLVMQFDDVRVNGQINQQVFVRAPLNGVPSFDLATGKVDNNGLQRAGTK